ncbi:MAG: rhodanese-like domain-containing protein [Bacteroidota bacterium]|nr:rhodanese-like domain-containing protein [Bacteroidota bacterium]
MDDITVEELKNKMNKNDSFILIDVRENYEHTEFNIGGTLASLNASLAYKIDELKGHEQDEIIVYCKSGNRSGIAKNMFIQAGFKNVRNLIGGMIAWRNRIG